MKISAFHTISALVAACALFATGCTSESTSTATQPAAAPDHLWQVYDQTFRQAKYIDLSHVITPQMTVWRGFAQPKFSATVAGRPLPDFAEVGEQFTFEKHGFEATSYVLPTDQLGTQLDPPAHWAPEYAAIDEIPVTYSLRPLVVISIVDQVASDPGYNLQVSDIETFEARHGRIPEGSVVMVRSDWSKGWHDPAHTAKTPFPGVGLDALKFLHLERNILFHGHEPLDTDASPTFEGEHWLLHNGYAQGEGVMNLDQVKETGCLLQTGFPKFKGGIGGYARYVAICPSDWPHGVRMGELQEVPLPKFDKPLIWNEAAGTRVRE